MTDYRTLDVPVRGGVLRVGRWGAPDASRTVLAVHGITSNHRAWDLVAAELTRHPDVQVIAPDLRGRGHSAELPGPWGMQAHAADLAAVLDAVGAPAAAVVGHSMGAFVAMVFAHRHPAAISSLLLVDGGVPLPPPDGVDPVAAAEALLGPAADRLRRRFTDRAEYLEFWKSHPAFTPWRAEFEDYVDYDLIGSPPDLRSRCSIEAMRADSLDLAGPGAVDEAWTAPPTPVRLLRAPAGLMADPPGLYPPDRLDDWARRHPGFSWTTVDDVNHYTITLGRTGAAAVAAALLAGR